MKNIIKLAACFLLLVFLSCSITVDMTTLDLGSTEVRKELTLAIEGNVEWNISYNKDWVTINPNNGQSTQPITPQSATITTIDQKVKVMVNRAGLNPGDYEATLTISDTWNLPCPDVMVKMAVAPEPPIIVVEGYVYDAETDEPISGVQVTVEPNGDTTNESGYYIVSLPELGLKTITASKEGYAEYSENINVENETFQHDIYMISITETTTTVKSTTTTIEPTILYGTTIITHGFRLTFPDWPEDMAKAIRERAGMGKVLVYHKDSGAFKHLPDSPQDSSGEVILVFDWEKDSNNFFYGYSEAAGDALFAALIKGEQNGDFDLNNLHFIGHSRGCVVNGEAVERLLAIGRNVDHVTNLDPHDWGAGTFKDGYDVNPRLFPPDSGVVSWIGINWTDTYWQNSFIALDGRKVVGTYNLYLGTHYLGHDYPYDWYYDTIDNSSSKEGYYYSRIGGGNRSSVPIEGSQTPVQFNFELEGIVNGDFQRGPMGGQHPFPGWGYHGGSGDGHVDSQHLELDRSSTKKTHNRFYIPKNAKSIWFLFRVWESDAGTPPDIDRLDVSIDDTSISKFNYQGTIKDKLWLNEETSNSTFCSFDVSNYQGSVRTLKFEIKKVGLALNSEVWIDNVQIELCTNSDDDSYTLCEGDCDDENEYIYPGNTNTYCDCDSSDGYAQGTTEICDDGIDNDCDGSVDEECTEELKNDDGTF
jgi:hypothetical protein